VDFWAYAVIGLALGLGLRIAWVLLGMNNWRWFWGLNEEEDGPLELSFLFAAVVAALADLWLIFVGVGLLAIYFFSV